MAAGHQLSFPPTWLIEHPERYVPMRDAGWDLVKMTAHDETWVHESGRKVVVKLGDDRQFWEWFEPEEDNVSTDAP